MTRKRVTKKSRRKSSPRKATRQARGKSPASAAHPEYVDREIAWLMFNQRVLEQAQDESMPLLERVKFLSIFHSNLDEFFMKRIWRHRDLEELPGSARFIHRFDEIRCMVQNLLKEVDACYRQSIRPKLKDYGIQILKWEDLSKEEKISANKLFKEKIFPVLTPLAVDPAHPFPHLSNLSTSLAVSLRYPGRKELLFARLKIPGVFPSYFNLASENGDNGNSYRMVSLLDVIKNNLQALFPNMEIVKALPFRVTRNIEIDSSDEQVNDLIEMVTQELKERRFGEVVKLECPPNPDSWLLRFLMAELDLTEEDVFFMEEEVDYANLNAISSLRIPDLKFKPWTAVTPPYLEEENIGLFDLISQKDIFVHHPFESFKSSVEKFIRKASEDPNVLAIKMTLYRTTEESSFMRSLIRAAEAGKQVVCMVELKARFDEERNIEWARKLEDAGVHVVYGIVGLKTHAKTALVVRKEPDGIKCYAHIGTGNYHALTAKLYTDVGILTSDPELTHEVVELFHHLTGRSLKSDYKNLLVAPFNMKRKFIELIEEEIALAKSGKPARIIIKLNNLEDHDICQALYRASQSGVSIDLIVRSICTLKAGVPGLSENIRVTSIVDRFLEHSRIFYFQAGAETPENGKFFIGSADWMYRNLLGRVEVIAPIFQSEPRERLWHILTTCLSDHTQCWEMKSDGTYFRRQPIANHSKKSSQKRLMEASKELANSLGDQ